MSGWNYPLLESNTTSDSWFWINCTQVLSDNNEQFGEWFEVQQYVGPVQRLYVYPGTGDGHYRILTKIPAQRNADARTQEAVAQRIIASARTRAKAQEFVALACVEIIPRVKGLTQEAFLEVLPSLIEKLAHQTTLQILRDWNVLEEDGIHTVDLAAIIEGIKCDSLMMSITFEYEYKHPPPPELLCETCRMPAVDPYVSPVFSGKVFCSSCTVFEGGSHFLKANNLASMLDGLEVYCPFASFGCGVVASRGSLGDHLQECPHVRIVCVNKQHGCAFAAKSKAEAIEHMQFCQFLPSICNELTHHLHPAPSSLPSLPLPSRLYHTRVGDVINAANTRATHEAAHAQEDNLHKRRKCKFCAREEEEVARGGKKVKEEDKQEVKGEDKKDNGEAKEERGGEECAYHSGTWNGYTYTEVQEWRHNVWRRRLQQGVKCVVHFPIEVAKSTTALGVGIVSFGALVAGAVTVASTAFLPEMLLAGGFLMVIPSPITSLVVGTVFSPSMFCNLLYKLPYRLLWGRGRQEETGGDKEDPKGGKKREEGTQEWTCCNKMGSRAQPCEKSGEHAYV